MSKFIVFEGIDRSGKTTQINRLYHYLKEKEIKFFKTREPYSDATREKLKTTILKPEEQLDLILKDRIEHCHLIRYMMENSDVVLCDRFTLSTVAYQGYGHGLDLYQINKMNEVATQGLTPDLVLVFDCPVGVAVKRGQDKPLDVMERDLFFLERVRAGYLHLSSQYGYSLIDANRTEDKILNETLFHLERVVGSGCLAVK